MILFVYYLQQQLQQQQLLLIALLLQLSLMQRNVDVSAQWITVAEFSTRVPGRCSVVSDSNSNLKNWRRQQFDCGGNQLLPQQRRCIPLQHFHDGITDCPDGSDEFCFPGYVKCGSYCVSLQYAAQCFINPKCDNSPTSPQFCDVTKKKLCSVEGTVPCKGYGECVMRKWIEKGQTNCIDKSDQGHFHFLRMQNSSEDLAYIAIFGIKRGINLYPGLPFDGNTSDYTNNIQKFIPSWLQSVSSSPSYLGLTDDTDLGPILNITKYWNSTTTQSTTKQFVFKMPNNNLNGQDFKSSDFDTAIVGFSNNAGIINDSNQINHQVQQNSRNVVSNIGQQSSSTFQNFTMRVDGKQAESGHNSNATTIIYQPHLTTVKSDKADDSVVEISQPSFIYHPGENPMDRVSEKSENSIKASTNLGILHNYEKLNDTQYKELLLSVKSSDNTRIGNDSNRLEYRGNIKQGNVIATNDFSLSSFSLSSSQSQNQHDIFNPSTTKPSNELNQQSDGHNINALQNGDLSSIITSIASMNPSPDQMACARYEYAEAQRLIPKPSCTCPPGQMPSGYNDEHVACKTTTVSTFGVDVHDMCGGLETDPNERSRLAILVLNRTRLPYQACVRRDGHPVMVQLDCSHCTVTEFDEAFKRNSNDQYIPLRIMELSLGACLSPALNDCDSEHADCLVDGPRYECRCHEGWNDTSKESGLAEGRRCEQLILLADGCILFLGYCLLWWFLLFGIILFLILLLLCWMGYRLCKWCKKRRRRNVVEEQGHLVISEVGSVKNLPTTESFNMNNSTGLISATDGKKQYQLLVLKAFPIALIKTILVKSQKHSNITVIQQKEIEMLKENGEAMKNTENIEFADPKVMNVSQSLSQASLRTMWELFKQGTWKQSSRPSSIISSTSSLDHLIDVFLCRNRSKKNHPDTTAISIGPEYPLDTVNTANLPVDIAPQLSSTVFTAMTTCSTISTTATITTATTTNAVPLLQSYRATNGTVQLFSAETPMQTQVLEQKIITETKTLTTRSTMPLLPGELPLSLNIATVQPSNPANSTAIFDRSETVQLDQQSVSNVASVATNAKPQQNDSINTNIDKIQHSAIEENAIVHQKPSTITMQMENETKDHQNIKPSTTTIVTSSDRQLKQWGSTTHPISNSLRQTQSEHGRRFTMSQKSANSMEERMSPIANELREALKEVTSTKPPTKRLTEKQKEKLSASCGHLHTQIDNEMEKKDGSIRQLLATSRHEPRRKLSSISEKSIEMINGGIQLISAPNSISCPTSTRSSKENYRMHCKDIVIQGFNCFFVDLMTTPLSQEPINCSAATVPISDGFVAALEGNFNSMEDGSNKLQQNQTYNKVRRRTDSDRRQHPISTLDLQPSWDFSPLKDGDLDRIAPLRPVLSYSNRPRNGFRHYIWMTNNSSGVKWTPNGTQDQSRPVKEQLWWGGH
ncbi:hypothetical protein DINM_006923 [Dirofilaria immitis]|nr:hypothetical protein [Dirofilaria immitis]